MISGNCLICGSFFTAKRNTQKFCSRKCNGINLIHKVEEEKIVDLYKKGATIEEVSVLMKVSRKVVSNVLKRNDCKTRPKIKRNQTGSNNLQWKGGRQKNKAGYILLYSKSHPFASKKGLVMEHRLVMESEIGRFLSPEEVVHHKNFIKDDNRIENLQLMTNGEHIALHNQLRAKSYE